MADFKILKQICFSTILFVSAYAAHDTTGLKGSMNRFMDMEVAIDTELNDTAECFEKRLSSSLSCWKANGAKAVWLALPIKHVAYLPVLLKKNFQIHHARPEKIVLTAWLKDGERVLPRFPSTDIAVAALVVDSENRVLMVKERFGALQPYKFPGGAVEMGEDIADAAVREVLEETGIEADFVKVLAFRHSHNLSLAMDRMSKLYFCCILRPKTSKIIIQESEILEAHWVPIEELKSQVQGIFADFLRLYESHSAGIASTYDVSKKHTIFHAVVS